MATTKRKPVVVTQKIMIKKSNHTTTKGHRIREGSKVRKEGRIYKKRKINKMTIVKPFINHYFKQKWVKFSHQKREWLNELRKKKKNKIQRYAAYWRLTAALKTHTD